MIDKIEQNSKILFAGPGDETEKATGATEATPKLPKQASKKRIHLFRTSNINERSQEGVAPNRPVDRLPLVVGVNFNNRQFL